MKNIYFYYFAIIAPLALLIYLVRQEFINSVIFSILIVSYSLIYRTYVDGKRLVDKTIITKAEILNQIFISSLNYTVQNKYSDTINLENKSTENLLNKTYQELVIRLAQNIITK